MGLPEAKADLKIAAEGIATATTVDELKAQMLDNLIPAIEGVAQAANDELAERDSVISTLIEDVEDLVDDRGDILQPETTEKILGVFELGGEIAKMLEATIKTSKDDLVKKRAASLIKSYRQGVLVTQDYLAEITVPVEEEPDAVVPSDAPEAQEADDDDDDDDDLDDDDLEDDEADDDDEEEEDDAPRGRDAFDRGGR